MAEVLGCAPREYGFFHATTMCLSALLAAGRNEQLLALVDKCRYPSWTYRKWGAKALVAMGKKTEALHYAESTPGKNEPSELLAEACEAILLSSGLADEAYQRYALDAKRSGTYLATFRAICRKYPHKLAEEVLNDLVASTPGDEGKWFAAAKQAADTAQGTASALAHIRQILDSFPQERFVKGALAKASGLSGDFR